MDDTIVCQKAPIRLAAFIIDIIALTIIQGFVVVNSFMRSMPLIENEITEPSGRSMFGMVITLVIIDLIKLVNIVALPVYFGGSIGKLILKLKIVAEDGRYMTFKQSIIRSFPYIIYVAVTHLNYHLYFVGELVEYSYWIFIIITLVALVANKENRTLHDLWARTFVFGNKDSVFKLRMRYPIED